MPRVSVLMPVYNARRYLAESLESVLAQTFGDLELVAVDDGSSDGSSGILAEAARREPRLVVLRQANAGIVSALNAGLARCSGAYVARIDADDLAEPGRLATQVAHLDAHPGIFAVGSAARVIDPRGRGLGLTRPPLEHSQIDAAHLRGESAIHHSAVMLRSDAVHRVGGYREGTCPAEDYDLWLRLGEVGRLANLPEALIQWRRTTTGILASTLREQEQVVARILAEAWERRGLPGSPPAPRRAIQSRADLYRQWGWMAHASGDRRLAAHYGLRACLREPWSPHGWRLLLVALRDQLHSRGFVGS